MASSRPSASRMRMLPVVPNGTNARCCLQIGCQPAYRASTPKGKQETPTSVSGRGSYKERIQAERRNRRKHDDHDVGPKPSCDDGRRKTDDTEPKIILDEKNVRNNERPKHRIRHIFQHSLPKRRQLDTAEQHKRQQARQIRNDPHADDHPYDRAIHRRFPLPSSAIER